MCEYSIARTGLTPIVVFVNGEKTIGQHFIISSDIAKWSDLLQQITDKLKPHFGQTRALFEAETGEKYL